jgi:hypothetical protein
MCSKHLRTKSDSAISSGTDISGPMNPLNNITGLNQNVETADRDVITKSDQKFEEPKISHLVQQLHGINARRSVLLKHLDSLQNEEDNVLTQLALFNTKARHVRLPHTSTTTLPEPSIYRIPSITQPIRKPLHARTVSAPSSSRSRQLATNDEPGGLTKVQLPIHSGRTTRVPTKLDASEPGVGSTTVKVLPTTPSRRGRAKNKSRSRSKGRMDTLVETLGRAGSYDLPDTVSRKRWEF